MRECHDFTRRAAIAAVIAEHGAFVRKACSLLCATHVGLVWSTIPPLDPMQHYENLYAEYFDLYCSTLFTDEGVVSVRNAHCCPCSSTSSTSGAG